MTHLKIYKKFDWQVLIVVSTLLFTTSCFEPTSKEAYIDKFEKFVDDVAQDHKNYKKKDWEYADKHYAKFSSEWYNKFKDEFTLKEQIKVAGLMVRYQSFKGENKLEKFYNDVLKEDVDKIREKIEYYVENDMDDDLDKLIKGAEEIGDSLLEVVEGIIHDIKD